MFSFNSLNITTAVGRLGKDAEVREFGEKKTKVVSFSIAVDTYDPKAENKKGPTTWLNCQSFDGMIIKMAPDHLKKGCIVQVVGESRTRTYKDKDQQDRSITEIHVFAVCKISEGKAAGSTSAPAAASTAGAPSGAVPPAPPSADPIDDDIPF